MDYHERSDRSADGPKNAMKIQRESKGLNHEQNGYGSLNTFKRLKRCVVDELGLFHQVKVVFDAIICHLSRFSPIEKVVVVDHASTKIRLYTNGSCKRGEHKEKQMHQTCHSGTSTTTIASSPLSMSFLISCPLVEDINRTQLKDWFTIHCRE